MCHPGRDAALAGGARPHQAAPGRDDASSFPVERYPLADVETRFADAWEAHSRAELTAILDHDDGAKRAAARRRAEGAISAASRALGRLQPPRGSGARSEEDRRAIAAMHETLELLAAGGPAVSLAVETAADRVDPRPAAMVLASDGLAALLSRTTAEYTRAAEAVELDGRTVDRAEVLARLATEPDEAERRRLFLSLEPLWRAVDADGGPGSPYRVAIQASAAAWRRDGSPVDASARALGVEPAVVEPWLRAILEAWREVAVGAPVEPWDERSASGAFDRALDGEVSLEELRRINDAWYASLGADPVALGIHYDLAPRPGRGPVPVAFMLDVDIPRRRGRGWTAGEQWVLASYRRPSLPDLAELLHETGHAVHSRAIRARPAYAILPESMTTLIEALGDLAAWDLYEPDWQARWLGRRASLEASLGRKYADVVRDVAWSLFEIELHRAPGRAPNEVWTELTGRYLGVIPHPEWSWWAIRGQLVQTPGYMVNYGLGAIVTADLRARLRELRGDRPEGDRGWYAVVSEALYRWGAARDPGEVLRAFLGRPISPEALIADLRRIGGGVNPAASPPTRRPPPLRRAGSGR